MHGVNISTVPTHLCLLVLKWAHWQLYLTWDLGFLWWCTWWLLSSWKRCSVVGGEVSQFSMKLLFPFSVCSEDKYCMFLWSGGTYLPYCIMSHLKFSVFSCTVTWGYYWAEPLCSYQLLLTEIVIAFLRLCRHISESAATIAFDFHCPLATHKLVSCPVLHT